MTEPWLTGSIEGYDPVISHLLRSAEHIRHDVNHWFANTPEPQLWQTEAGFHLQHLANSTNRLCTYLKGQSLDPLKLQDEHIPTPGVLDEIAAALTNYEALLKQIDPKDFPTPRYVGRKRLQVTVASLAIHIAEHAQRHLGQAITAAKGAKLLTE